MRNANFKNLACLMFLGLALVQPVWSKDLEPKKLTEKIDLAEKLPVAVVQELMKKDLWRQKAYEEQAENKDRISLYDYATKIQNASVPVDVVADALFEPGSCNPLLVTECETYSVKVLIFRHSALPISAERKKDLAAAFVKKYLKVTLSLIRHSQFSEMQNIVDRMYLLINTNQIKLVDLDPAYKDSLPSYGHLNSQDAYGAYLPKTKTFGIDLSKSISENIVTVTHEIVHAADPSQDDLRFALQNIYPEVVSRVSRSLESPNFASKLVYSLLVDIYFDIGGSTFGNYVRDTVDAKLAKLDKEIKNSSDPDLSKDAVIQKWTKLLIKASVENEFKAHLFSCAVYYQLAVHQQIIPSSTRIVALSDYIVGNVSGFALNRGLIVDPFNKELALGSMSSASDFGAEARTLKSQINIVKSTLQFQYLNELKVETDQYPQRYAGVLAYIQNRQQAAADRKANLNVLPDYARKGFSENTISPYTLLSARLKTAWVLRFKEASEILKRDIHQFKGSLLLMKLGVFDLIDVTQGELALLGLESSYSATLSPEQAEFIKYFNMVSWSQGTSLQQKEIAQDELMSNLYRLYLLKILSWFENKFPVAQENLISIKILQGLIRDGQYDHDEISEDRIKELGDELVLASDLARVSGDSLLNIKYLFDTLGGLYEIGFKMQPGADWSAVTERFANRMRFGVKDLEENGYYLTFNAVVFENDFKASAKAFKAKMQDLLSEPCQRKDMQFIPTVPAINLMDYSVSRLTTLCDQKNIYVFRQPGGKNHSAPTQTINGRPFSQTSHSSRRVILNPLTESASGWFNFNR